jgi:hypothetical protein
VEEIISLAISTLSALSDGSSIPAMKTAYSSAVDDWPLKDRGTVTIRNTSIICFFNGLQRGALSLMD